MESQNDPHFRLKYSKFNYCQVKSIPFWIELLRNKSYFCKNGGIKTSAYEFKVIKYIPHMYIWSIKKFDI